jgi:putative hydrolase of the HAD superfamily
MQQDLHPDHAMTALVRRLKEQGVAVALVSNSLGRDCYTGHGLDELFEVQAISGREGVRKPSRRLYEVACERLGVRPAEAIMIDDLAMNIRAAHALGMGGIVHSDATRTIPALAGLLGLDPETLGAEPATTGT